MPTKEKLFKFIAAVERGQFRDALLEFYADGATAPDTGSAGMATLLESERRAVGPNAATPAVRAESFILDGDLVAINWVFEYSDVKGRRRRLDEIAYQVWNDGKITRERFFYDPGSVSMA